MVVGTMDDQFAQYALRILPFIRARHAMNTFGGFCGAGARGSELPSPLGKICSGAKYKIL